MVGMTQRLSTSQKIIRILMLRYIIYLHVILIEIEVEGSKTITKYLKSYYTEKKLKFSVYFSCST